MLAGCAAVSSTQQALVCPQCKTVYFNAEGRGQASSFGAATGAAHRCQGCQGSMRTLLTEGKLEHACSVCQQQGFTCEGHAW